MRTTRQQGVLGVVRCATGPSSRVRDHNPPVQHFFAAVINVTYMRFKADKKIVDAHLVVHLT